jgi:hypothetical protein
MNTPTNKTSGIISLDALNSEDPFGFNAPADNLGEPAPAPVLMLDDPDDNDGLVPSSLNSNDNNKSSNSDEEEEDASGASDDNNDRGKQTLNLGIDRSSTELLRNQLKKLNIESVVQTVEGEEVETSIDEIDITDELFADLVQNYIEAEKEKATADKISINGVSDITKALIEIERRGGDTSQVLAHKSNYLDPLDQLDLETTAGQKKAIALYLTANGKDQEDIDLRLRNYEQQGQLEEKATEFSEQIRKAVSDFAIQQEAAAVENEKKVREQFKVYKKTLKDALGTTFELNDTVKNKLVDFATKAGEGNRFEFDIALMNVRRDPALSAELALWLQDKEEYVKQITNKRVIEEKKKTLVRIGVAKDRKPTGQPNLINNAGSSSSSMILLDD